MKKIADRRLAEAIDDALSISDEVVRGVLSFAYGSDRVEPSAFGAEGSDQEWARELAHNVLDLLSSELRKLPIGQMSAQAQ